MSATTAVAISEPECCFRQQTQFEQRKHQTSLRSHEEPVLSTIKTPQDKKRQSYQHDRRNTYGENQKSSRKNIPRSKQRSHQDERRSVRQVLGAAQGDIASEVADEAQSQALVKGRMKKLQAFRKSPDRPLGEVVKRRLRRRTAELDYSCN
jgi:hypothetical protein